MTTPGHPGDDDDHLAPTCMHFSMLKTSSIKFQYSTLPSRSSKSLRILFNCGLDNKTACFLFSQDASETFVY